MFAPDWLINGFEIVSISAPQLRGETVTAPIMNEAETHSRKISSHSILFVPFEAKCSLGLSAAASMVEPKIGSTGWIGFFTTRRECWPVLVALASAQSLVSSASQIPAG